MIVHIRDGLDRPYLADLIARFGMEKIEEVTRCSRTTIYQWKPTRIAMQPEAALRVAEFYGHLGYQVETMCPELPWHLLYRGRDRRNGFDGWQVIAAAMEQGDYVVEAALKHVGLAAVARTAGYSRQVVYDALKAQRCPVWLALAIEAASEQRYLVEDFRPDLPWWPLYGRGEDSIGGAAA